MTPLSFTHSPPVSIMKTLSKSFQQGSRVCSLFRWSGKGSCSPARKNTQKCNWFAIHRHRHTHTLWHRHGISPPDCRKRDFVTLSVPWTLVCVSSWFFLCDFLSAGSWVVILPAASFDSQKCYWNILTVTFASWPHDSNYQKLVDSKHFESTLSFFYPWKRMLRNNTNTTILLLLLLIIIIIIVIIASLLASYFDMKNFLILDILGIICGYFFCPDVVFSAEICSLQWRFG